MASMTPSMDWNSNEENCIRSQMMEVKKAEKAVDAARLKLQEAMQERKMHERLREKAFDVFLEELALAESKEIDGLVSYTHGVSE